MSVKREKKVSKEEVEVEVRTVIANQLNQDPENIALTKSFQDLGLDSLDQTEIMMQLEEIYEFEVDQATAENLKTGEDVVNLLVEKFKSS